MDTRSSVITESGDITQGLELLYDAFSCVFSIEEIANAYKKAEGNVDLAGEILSGWTGSSSNAPNHFSSAKPSGTDSSEPLSDETSEKSSHAAQNRKAAKPRKYSVSMGTVSSVIGKGYVAPPPVQSGSCRVNKPLKLDSKELPMDELFGEVVSSDVAAKKNDAMCKDVEDFLLQMLENGFQLDMSLIQEAFGSCGYDMKKFTDNFPKSQSLRQEKSKTAELVQRNGTESPDQDKKKHDLSKEVLNVLFNVPERTEQLPRSRPPRALRRTRTFGTVVVEPPNETTMALPIVTMVSQQEKGNDEDENYQILRRAFMEHRATKKEYYKAAVEAFVKGERTLAEELLKEAEFFNEKAREADEKSSQLITEGRKEIQDDISIDLHTVDVREAIHLLKSHLAKFCGIQVIQYLKVIVESNGVDISNGARKRLVKKLLDRESIKWTEVENGAIMLIRVDEVDPQKLSWRKATINE